MCKQEDQRQIPEPYTSQADVLVTCPLSTQEAEKGCTWTKLAGRLAAVGKLWAQ